MPPVIDGSSSAAYTQTPPKPHPEETAVKLIDQNGGKDNLNTEQLGKDLAELARTDPEYAWKVAQEIFGSEIDEGGHGRLKEADKDEVAQSFIRALSEDELDRLAQSGEAGVPMLQRMQQHLLSGSVHSDERADADRIQGALNRNTDRIFTPAYPGVEMSGNPGTSMDTTVSPEEAAAAIRTPAGIGNEASYDKDAFVAQLKAHEGDAAWLKSFYAALGQETAGKLIASVVNPNTYFSAGLGGGMFGNPAKIREDAAVVLKSLETLRASGSLTQADMDLIVSQMKNSPYAASEIFAKTQDPQLRNMFFLAAARSGDDTMKAAASGVLASMSIADQQGVLNLLKQENLLDGFIAGAERGAGQVVKFDDAVRPTSMASAPPTFVQLDGVEKLLTNAADGKYSPELKRALFVAASAGLTDDEAFKNFEDNKTFKDALSRIYIDESTTIVSEGSTTNGLLKSATDKALTGFFAYAVFTDKPGDYHSRLQDLTLKQFGDMGQRLTDASLTGTQQEIDAARLAYQRKYGSDPTVDATRAGGMFRAVENGLQLAQQREIESEQQRKENVALLVSFGAALIPGVGGYVGKLASNEIVSHVLSESTGFVQGKLTSAAEDGLTSALSHGGDDNLDDAELGNLRGAIAGTLPNDNYGNGKHSLNLLDAFDSGYNQTGG